jgi:hypothetical protein
MVSHPLMQLGHQRRSFDPIEARDGTGEVGVGLEGVEGIEDRIADFIERARLVAEPTNDIVVGLLDTLRGVVQPRLRGLVGH